MRQDDGSARPLWHAFMKSDTARFLDEEQFPEAHYSEEFELDIHETTGRLKSELAGLYRRFGLDEMPGG